MGLDPKAAATVLEQIDTLRRNGTAVLLVEQNARKALELADHGCVLDLGRIAIEGPGAGAARQSRVRPPVPRRATSAGHRRRFPPSPYRRGVHDMTTSQRPTDALVTIAMNGVTGRMGRNQHLERSIIAIREQGGVARPDGSVIRVRPVLVGRNAAKLAELAATYGVEDTSTDLDSVLADPSVDVYFDAQTTDRRADAVIRAIKAGKHIYCEKPLAEDAATARTVAAAAEDAGVIAGIVQDKLFLPGLVKLRRLLDSGFFGRILSVRIDFGYWVFEGDREPSQRPSWNYRREDGGGIVLDMYPHWHYVIEELFGEIEQVLVLASTHIPERVDEAGQTYRGDG